MPKKSVDKGSDKNYCTVLDKVPGDLLDLLKDACMTSILSRTDPKGKRTVLLPEKSVMKSLKGKSESALVSELKKYILKGNIDKNVLSKKEGSFEARSLSDKTAYKLEKVNDTTMTVDGVRAKLVESARNGSIYQLEGELGGKKRERGSSSKRGRSASPSKKKSKYGGDNSLFDVLGGSDDEESDSEEEDISESESDQDDSEDTDEDEMLGGEDSDEELDGGEAEDSDESESDEEDMLGGGDSDTSSSSSSSSSSESESDQEGGEDPPNQYDSEDEEDVIVIDEELETPNYNSDSDDDDVISDISSSGTIPQVGYFNPEHDDAWGGSAEIDMLELYGGNTLSMNVGPAGVGMQYIQEYQDNFGDNMLSDLNWANRLYAHFLLFGNNTIPEFKQTYLPFITKDPLASLAILFQLYEEPKKLTHSLIDMNTLLEFKNSLYYLNRDDSLVQQGTELLLSFGKNTYENAYPYETAMFMAPAWNYEYNNIMNMFGNATGLDSFSGVNMSNVNRKIISSYSKLKGEPNKYAPGTVAVFERSYGKDWGKQMLKNDLIRYVTKLIATKPFNQYNNIMSSLFINSSDMFVERMFNNPTMVFDFVNSGPGVWNSNLVVDSNVQFDSFGKVRLNQGLASNLF